MERPLVTDTPERRAQADRDLDAIDVCRCTTQVDGAGVCGNTAAPECVPTACPLQGQPGQCPSGYSNAIETAYDGRVGRDDGWTAAIVAGDGTTIDTIGLDGVVLMENWDFDIFFSDFSPFRVSRQDP